LRPPRALQKRKALVLIGQVEFDHRQRIAIGIHAKSTNATACKGGNGLPVSAFVLKVYRVSFADCGIATLPVK